MPAGSQNAQISPQRGRPAAVTQTVDPDTIVWPMDEPATSMRSGSVPARSRSSRANDSGFVLDIAGLPVLVHASDAEHLAVIRAVFGTASVCTSEPQAEISYGPGRLPSPDAEPDIRQPDLEMWTDGEVLHLASEPHGVWARVSPTHAEIVGEAPAHERSLRRIFQPVITHILAHRGIFVIHAASMRKGDRGVLALGETGKGKSTLALAALLSDWRVMGDDLVALWIDDDTLMMRGLPKPMALPNDLPSPHTAPLEGAETMEWDQRGRLHVPTDRLDLDAVKLGTILVVEHGETEHSTIEPTDADLVTSWLMASYTSVGDAPMMRRFFPVAARAARVPRWIVRHGTDPAVRITDAQRILSDLIAGS
jgi:hypothetical protein